MPGIAVPRLAALALALGVAAAPALAALPAERELPAGPADPSAPGAVWELRGRDAGAATLPLALSLNTTVVSPPVWVPKRAQALAVRAVSPGGGTLIQVSALPLEGGPPIALGTLEPVAGGGRLLVPVRAVAGRSVRLQLDPVTAYGATLQLTGIGPFLETLPGWRVLQGLPDRNTATGPVVVRDTPLEALRVARVGPGRAVSVRVRGSGRVRLRVGARGASLRAGSTWRTLRVPVGRAGTARVLLTVRPGEEPVELTALSAG